MVFYKFLNRNFKNTNYFCNSNEELLYVRHYVCCGMVAGVGQCPFAQVLRVRGIRCAGLTRHSTASGLAQVLRASGKPLCMAALSFPLSQGFSTLHDINVFRCNVAEFSDDLAGDKRLIVLNISTLQQMTNARSYEKTYNLAGIPTSYIYRNHLITNALSLFNVTKSSARLSDI